MATREEVEGLDAGARSANPALVLFRQAWQLGVCLAVMLLAWEFAGTLFRVPQYLLPQPSVILQHIVLDLSILLPHIWVTLYETVLGFILACAVGVVLAIGIAHSEFLRNGFYPILVFLQTTPKIAVAPLFIIWFGFGFLPKIVLSFLICFFPIVINMALGLITVDPDMLDLLRNFRASEWQVFKKVRFPNSLSYLFAGMKIAVPLAVIGAVVGEFIGSDKGLGYMILYANSQLNTILLFSALFYLSLMGVVLFGLIVLLEKVIAPWAPSVEVQAKTGGV